MKVRNKSGQLLASFFVPDFRFPVVGEGGSKHAIGDLEAIHCSLTEAHSGNHKGNKSSFAPWVI